MTEHNTLLLIDGHSMAFRAFYALRPDMFRTSTGQYTNAVHGFINTLLRLVKDYEPTHIAVAFDLPGGTFRTREYADYKGGRKATPEEFKGQIGVIQEVLNVLGISWLTYEDYEADDIVATLATVGEAAGMRVYVASGDKDSYQLVDDDVTVLYPMPRSQMLEMTPEAVEAKTGVRPEQYSDLAALVGEKADNIVGVPGVGQKTAAKWIKEYGSLSELLAHAHEIKTKAGQALREHTEQVQLNRCINQLVRDLPLSILNSKESGADTLAALIPQGVDIEAMHDLFDTLDFQSVRRRVLAELPRRGQGDTLDLHSNASNVLESAAKAVESINDTGSASLREFLAQHQGPYGISVTGDTSPGRAAVDQFAIATRDGNVYAAELAHLGSDDTSCLASWLADSASQKIGHGVKGMIHAWKGSGYDMAGIAADTELAAYLLHPDERSYPLPDLARRYLSLEISQPHLSLDLGMFGIDESLGESAAATIKLYDVLIEELARQKGAQRLMELEVAVTQALVCMEERGIAVDQDSLQTLQGSFEGRVLDAERIAREAADAPTLNLKSPKQLQEVLFEDMGLPHTKKTKRGYTTNAEALAWLLEKIAYKEDDASVRGQKFLSALLEHRDAIKLLQSVEGLEKAVHDDGRIRTTYQQTVAATGRLSSSEPNLQNIHARTEEGVQIRAAFVPGKGFDYLMTADYSQIEMRIMAHMSNDTELIAAFNAGADLHRYVAARVFGISENSVSPAQRSRIKAMSYGLVYGLSAYGLSSQLHISVSEAQRLMDGYFSRFGKVKRYLDGVVEQARRDGYTQTIMGRRRYLPELSNTNQQIREAAERMALNAPIQGSAADIIKIAMVATERAMREARLTSRILLQVHDELVLEIVAEEAEQVKEIVKREMGNAWPDLSVPLTVGIGVGRSWRDAAH